MTTPPRDIKVKRAERVIEMTWLDGERVRFPFRYLRGECACAACVDEFTGVRTLDVDAIPNDISVNDMSLVGNYAAKIVWSDGHDTGIYTWQKLRQLARTINEQE